ncbi:uracil-DNA glycosylase [uncultured Sphingomonas sp.]|uniref:uracil-DNA glycosylase n=1 Tax=uncultured Sphingomonas sp. TaxID=158754 RepID=UPI0035CA05E0
MGVYPQHDWQSVAASALDWWRDAGIDTLVDDLPRDWFAVPAVAVAPPVAVTAEPVSAQLPANVALPATLAALLEWRLGTDAPEASWSGISIAASGPLDAAVMVLVDCPDREDGPAATMLSGAPGRLFDRMLAAIGLSRETVHLTAVCARRPAAGRVDPTVEARLAEIALHHVRLVAPKRLLLLGNAASRAILGTDAANARGGLRNLNHDGPNKNDDIGIVASFHPRFLIEKPALKAEAWKDLQMLTRGLA